MRKADLLYHIIKISEPYSDVESIGELSKRQVYYAIGGYFGYELLESVGRSELISNS